MRDLPEGYAIHRERERAAKEMKTYQMNKVALTVFILIIASGIIDLGFVVFGGVNGTISAFVVGVIGPKAPWVFFVTGCVVGHLVFPVYVKEDK